MVERYHGLYFCVKLCSREVRPVWDNFPAIIFHTIRQGESPPVIKEGEKEMRKKTKKRSIATALFLLVLTASAMMVFGADEAAAETSRFVGTFWSLIPPIVAIALALITKEVYSSLFIGILVGGLFASGFSFEGTVLTIFEDGIVGSLTSSSNVGILVFLVMLGTIVCLMNKAGGSAAFGEFAKRKIKSRVGAQLATVALGCLIFIDDYFNCLAVGSVMRPVTDGHKISRAKLAYLIDSTAAPICIIAPVSSWAAAVTGYIDGTDGFSLFLKAIPFNFYALLTIIMMIVLAVTKLDFGPMRKHELNAEKGDLFTSGAFKETVETATAKTAKGTVVDLIIPIVALIICCVIGMLYTGGFFSGVGLIQAFSDSSPSLGLMLGSFFGLVVTIILYLIRRVLSFREIMDCLPEGFKAMVPAILILTLAWTLNGMTDMLGAAGYVGELVESSAGSFLNFLPAIVFLVACGLAFATGTSWGTLGILIPIVGDAFASLDPAMLVISVSACMAGAVCGDHCSPISDTTIMASAGAQCDHVNHVSTQLPYAITVAAISFVSYLIAGFTKSALITWPIALVLLIGIMLIMKRRDAQKTA